MSVFIFNPNLKKQLPNKTTSKAKDKIKRDYLELSAKQRKSVDSVDLTLEQLEEMYDNMWKNKGSNFISQYEESFRQSFNRKDISLTGAGLEYKEGEDDVGRQYERLTRATNKAFEAKQIIDEFVSQWIDVLDASQANLESALLINSLNEKGILPNRFKNKVGNKNGALDLTKAKELDSKFEKNLKRLADIYNGIDNVSQGGSLQLKNSQGKTKKYYTVDSLIEAATSSIAVIGGELVGETIAFENLYKQAESAKNIQEETLEMFKSIGQCTYKKSSEDKQKIQPKPDIAVPGINVSTNGGINITLFGSVKTYQGKGHIFLSDQINPTVSYESTVTIKKLLKEEGIGNKIFEYGLSPIYYRVGRAEKPHKIKKKEVEENFSKRWNNIKLIFACNNFINLFVGGGQELEGKKMLNFSDVFIYNEKVIPFWQIIKNIEKYISILPDTDYFNFTSNYRKEYKSMQPNNPPAKERYQREKSFSSIMNTIYAKKLSIKLNLLSFK